MYLGGDVNNHTFINIDTWGYSFRYPSIITFVNTLKFNNTYFINVTLYKNHILQTSTADITLYIVNMTIQNVTI